MLLCESMHASNAMADVTEWLLGQGAFVAAVLGIGWALAAKARLKELRKLHHYSHRAYSCDDTAHPRQTNASDSKAHKSAAKLQTMPMQPSPLPGVSIVLPARTYKPYSYHNWASQLRLQYQGPLEYIFVLGSQQDEAWPHLQSLKAEFSGCNIKVVASGPATSCSQKIHNLVHGARCSQSNSQYLLFLDDDVELHATALTSLVDKMEQQQDLFMVTGYPFDIPAPGAGLLTYATMAYHLPLLIAFSVTERTSFVWGGCMLLRRDNLLPDDKHGVLQAWTDGGYSDDLLLAALCTQQKLHIAVPPDAILPQWCEAQPSFSQYCNYLHRQLYVLDTYYNTHNRVLNHTMMAVHCWASTVLAAAMIISAWRVAQYIFLCAASGVHMWQHHTAHLTQLTAQDGLAPATAADSAARDRQGMSEPLAAMTAHLLTWSCIAFCCCFLAAQLGLWCMLRAVLGLLLHLEPTRRKILSPEPCQSFSFVMLWAGLLLESMLLPACIIYILLCPHVVWGGIRYTKRSGKVVAVRH